MRRASELLETLQSMSVLANAENLAAGAGVASAALAAIAASASWAAVAQTRRERLAAQRPDLDARLMVGLPGDGFEPGEVLIFVANVGLVAVTGVNFLVVAPDQLDDGVVANGFLAPGQDEGPIRTGIRVQGLPAPSDLLVVVTCRDRNGVLHAFTHLPGHTRSFAPGLFRRSATPPKQKIVAALFPGVVLDERRDVNR